MMPACNALLTAYWQPAGNRGGLRLEGTKGEKSCFAHVVFVRPQRRFGDTGPSVMSITMTILQPGETLHMYHYHMIHSSSVGRQFQGVATVTVNSTRAMR
jgi:hypothetical protein